MPKARIRYTQQAADDMDAIFDYVVLENPDAAERLLSQFDDAVLQLADAPYLGAAIPTEEPMMVSPGYRYLVGAPYLIFDRGLDGDVCVGRVLHSRQNWLALLFGRR